ncbi:hypothetical protein [Reyranella soli]|uniref:Uncharacterized protein n=1 Tax=Reyranella soli TaxID=1230389 RepID=A0A512NMJ6_9HYPH|nr:hypothetical protein [Reyranella soli]GEP60183.1 hypothetical protein RSO01_73490 [Reyranella soli]
MWFATDAAGLAAAAFAELQIWDEDNNAVRRGEADEIVAKCEEQMRGFWNNPRLDADRYLYVVDRADDRVISGSPFTATYSPPWVRQGSSVSQRERFGRALRPSPRRLQAAPKTSVGEIKRKELRERFRVGRQRN